MDEIKKHIDVIIPCYNVEETIEDCIKSLCNQSLSKNEYNCYFINDYSTDSTGLILDKYISVMCSEKWLRRCSIFLSE